MGLRRIPIRTTTAYSILTVQAVRKQESPYRFIDSSGCSAVTLPNARQRFVSELLYELGRGASENFPLVPFAALILFRLLRSSKLSGVVFALGAFDPRFAVLALPLFLFYNKSKLRNALVAMVIVLVAFNIVVLYPGTAQGFLSMVFGSGTTTPLYTPAWIPTVMLLCLIAVNARQMINELKKGLHSIQTRKQT